MTERPIPDGGDRERPPSKRRTTYEIGDERPSETVVRAVAAVTNTPVLELEPLYDVIDPDLLNRTIASTGDDVQVEFSFAFGGCEVTVTREEVRVRVPDADR